MGRGVRAAAWLAAALMGFCGSCLLELDPSVACGDGYVDPDAGEECDPLDESSFLDRCEATDRVLGEAVCDEERCTLLVGVQQCGRCGDGILDAVLGEECELGIPTAAVCAEGGEVVCHECRLDYSGCQVCGNRIVEGTEDCDTGQVIDSIKVARETCVGLAVPGQTPKTYTYGDLGCTDTCKYDLTGCGLCGNNEFDHDPITDPATGLVLRAAEVCEGNILSIKAVEQECSPLCGSDADGLSCTVVCDNGCLGVSVADPAAPGCCIRGGEFRNAALPCCCELQDNCASLGEVSPDLPPSCPGSRLG